MRDCLMGAVEVCIYNVVMGDLEKLYRQWQEFFGDYDAVFFDTDSLSGSIAAAKQQAPVE